jgi:hypothetical protein
MDQAVRDAKDGELPAVFHRKNNCETLVTMRMQDWFKIYKEWEEGETLMSMKNNED